jgi:mRNA interferase MazF
MTPSPQRGEIWLVDLDPTRGHEQAGRRPALILSVDTFNAGPADLVLAIPVTKAIRAVPTHVILPPPEGGVRIECAILCEALRSVSKERLVARWGRVSPLTLAEVEDRVRILLGL